MSIDVLSWVLKHSEETLGRRLVLIVLADCAHEDGTGAWPSVQTIADKARMSRRQVQRCLKDLEEAGAIEKDGNSRAGTTCWTVVMARDNLSGCQNDTGDNSDADPVENVTRTVKEELSDTPCSPPDPIQRVFALWQKVMDHPRAQLDSKRRRDIARGLKLGTLEECCRAVIGCSRSDYHMARGQYRGGTRYDRLGLILGNRDNIERFMALAPQTPGSAAPDAFTSSAVDAKIRDAKRNVLVAYDLAGSDEARRKGDESERWLLEHGIRVVRPPDSRPTFEDAAQSGP